MNVVFLSRIGGVKVRSFRWGVLKIYFLFRTYRHINEFINNPKISMRLTEKIGEFLMKNIYIKLLTL